MILTNLRDITPGETSTPTYDDQASSGSAWAETAGKLLDIVGQELNPQPKMSTMPLMPIKPPTPWYQSPWVWAGAAAVVVAVVVLKD